MNRRKVLKAVSGSLVVVLGTGAVTESADNPHTEPKQHEEEPRLTYDTPYTTTSMAVVTFPVWDSSLAAVPIAVLRQVKKK
jgi:hypothetical protein